MADETDGSVALTVVRQGGLFGQISALLTITGGTADKDIDFSIVEGTLTFVDGEQTKTIVIDMADDNQYEDNESIVLGLRGPYTGTNN